MAFVFYFYWSTGQSGEKVDENIILVVLIIPNNYWIWNFEYQENGKWHIKDVKTDCNWKLNLLLLPVVWIGQLINEYIYFSHGFDVTLKTSTPFIKLSISFSNPL